CLEKRLLGALGLRLEEFTVPLKKILNQNGFVFLNDQEECCFKDVGCIVFNPCMERVSNNTAINIAFIKYENGSMVPFVSTGIFVENSYLYSYHSRPYVLTMMKVPEKGMIIITMLKNLTNENNEDYKTIIVGAYNLNSPSCNEFFYFFRWILVPYTP
ncbi:hypothetical protein HZS_498, partial [Henneguya salminicola]